jgi:serine/threonine protein phosphatase PrpC
MGALMNFFTYLALNLSVLLNLNVTLCMEEPTWGIPMNYGVEAQKGNRRPTMEDAHKIEVPFFDEDTSSAFFAIYDGHGGRAVADFCANKLHTHVRTAFEVSQNMTEALKQGVINCDDELARSDLKTQAYICGSTAVIAIIKDTMLYLAHVGDARAILARDSKAISLTEDHKPDHPKERERIESMGGVISTLGVARINGLAVSRAIGDYYVRNQGVIPSPEVVAIPLTPQDEFIILGCDGLFERNVLTADAACSIVRQTLDTYKDQENAVELAAKELVDKALKGGSTDNVSAIVIVLQQDLCKKKIIDLTLEDSQDDLPSTQEI